MSEILLKPVNALIVSEVVAGSPAQRAGVQSGDLLREINGRAILDILDYRFHSADSRLVLTLQRGEALHNATLRKGANEETGMEFEFDLGDKIHTCKNKCVFCFIHQQPKKMRRSLYLMDDDFRLSFMHGNYVTLTNLTDEEWGRIKEQRLSPLYVSVHATDPELRRVLLGRKEATPILPQLRELADHRIDVHAQIVLCPGLNDGANLEKTLTELAAEHRAVTGKRAGVGSAAIVPVGMTRFRERLPQLQTVEAEYAREMIAFVNALEKRFTGQLGTRFAWLADEWYHLAGVPYPGKAHYEDFPQLEDGIGTVRLFLEDAKRVSKRLPARVPLPLQATLVTAEMPSRIVQEFAFRLNEIENVEVNVCVVKNDYFGGDIHIAGLMTAQDILTHLDRSPDSHSTVYLPKICLRDDLIFLDDVTLDELRQRSGRDIRVTGNTPHELCEAMGLLLPSRTGEPGGARWKMEGDPTLV